MREKLERFISRQVRRITHRPAICEDLYQALHGIVDDHNVRRHGRLQNPPRGPGLVSKRTLDYYLKELELLVQDLSPSREHIAFHDEQPAHEQRVTPGKTTTMDLPQREILVHKILCTNEAAAPVEGMYLFANGVDWSTREGLLRYINAQDLPGEQARAFSLYQFCRNHRRHGPAPSRHRVDRAIIDPMRYYPYYGYGMCGYTATSFAVLCALHGLDCRVWNINFHTMPEVRIEGRWQLLDPDAGAWYPLPGSVNQLADMEAITESPEDYILPLRYDPVYHDRKEQMSNAFGHRETNRVVAQGTDLARHLPPGETACLSGDLLPGERLEYRYQDYGPWQSTGSVYPPLSPPPGRASLKRHLDLNDHRLLAWTSGNTNDAGDDARLVRVETNGRTCFTVRLDQAWPAIDGRIRVDPTSRASGLHVATRRNRDSWQEVQALDGETPEDVYPLRRLFCGGDIGDVYQVKISHPAATVPRLLVVETAYQASPWALPRLRPGKNTLHCHGHCPGTDALRLTISYGLGPTVPAADAISCTSPRDGQTLSLDALDTLAWSVPPGTEGLQYELWLMDTAHPVMPVAPNFMRIVDETRLDLSVQDRSYLVPGHRYTWKVRVLDRDRMPLTEWSHPAEFLLVKP